MSVWTIQLDEDKDEDDGPECVCVCDKQALGLAKVESERIEFD